jgi:D-xylonolactonase
MNRPMNWEVLAHGYGLAEGPTIDVDGSLVFSDVLGGGVYRLDSGGSLTTVVPKRRGVGGIAIHADGGIVCSGRDVVHVRNGETRTVLHVDGVAGWNDLGTDKAGRVYAGALRFPVFDRDAEAVPGELWSVGGDAEPAPLVDDILHANGVAVSADDGTVYVSDSRRQCIVVFDVESSGRRTIDVSALGTPDGLALDEAGALFVALVAGGIARLRPDGAVDMRLDPPSAFTTSVCFAGRDLYVTTGGNTEQPELRGCVLRTTVDVAGATVFPARV